MATTPPINSANCKAFWPCNEGAGTTFTDAITGAVFTDASATHVDNAHAPGILATGLTGVEDGFIRIPGGSIIAVITGYEIVVAGLFQDFRLGTASGAKIEQNGTNFEIQADEGSSQNFINSYTGSPGGTDALTLTVIDQTAGVIYIHEALNSANSALFTTISANVPTGPITLDADGQLTTSGGTRQLHYGAALFVLPSLPSEAERNAALNFCFSEWTRGRKILPPQFA